MLVRHAFSFLRQPVCKIDGVYKLASCLVGARERSSVVSFSSSRSILCHKHLRTTMLQRRTFTSGPQLTVNPEGHLLIDDKLELKISGLDRQQKTTLHAVVREGKSVFESCCCYTADDSGEVNLVTQPSLAGSYTGVSPMGIFWSMVQAPGQKEGLRLMKKDMTTPMTTNITVFNDHLTVDAIRAASSDPVCLGSIDRWYMGPGVKREVVRHGRTRGVLYIPAGGGPFPGVIDLFGTAGGILEFRAALLASRGFACLSLPYFRYEDLPDDIFSGIDLEYFMEAIDWLCSHRDVFSDGVGVVGVSKGADLALILATYSPKVKCAVNINGMTFNASFGIKYKDTVIPPVEFQPDKMYEENGAFVCDRCWQYTEKDLTPVWKSDAKILNIVGEGDKSSPWQNIQFMKDRFPKEKTDNFEVVSYPKAGHLIEPPYAPVCNMSYHKSFGMKFWWGGHLEHHAFAQEDSWSRILNHLNKYIPRTSNSDTHIASKL